MKLAAIILCAAVFLFAVAATCYFNLDYFASDRLRRYYDMGFFDSALQRAINGPQKDRIAYYNIPIRFSLDGCYSEDYCAGIDDLVEKYGKKVIGEEVKMLGNKKIEFYYSDLIGESR